MAWVRRDGRFSAVASSVILAVALVATVIGASAVAVIAIALALGAAFLNAAFNFCLGCEIYLISKRVLVRA